MSTKLVDDTKLTAIGNAIRTKGSTQALLTLDQMPQAIDDLPSGGGGGGSIYTGKLTSMSQMFDGNNQITSLDLSSFNTSDVTTMQKAFNNCTNLASIDVTSFDTRKVTTMYYLFYQCSSLTSLDLGSFDTPVLTNIGRFLFGCSSLTSVNLASLDTSAITSASQPFNNCSSLQHIIWSQKSTVQPIPSTGTTFFPYSSMKIYVPNNLVNSYKAATNWSSISNQIKSINDLPAAVAALYAGHY